MYPTPATRRLLGRFGWFLLGCLLGAAQFCHGQRLPAPPFQYLSLLPQLPAPAPVWATAPTRPKPRPAPRAAASATHPPARDPRVQAAGIAWLVQHQDARETWGYNRGPLVNSIIVAGGGVPGQEWCGFTQAADQRANKLPIPKNGMQGAARAWFLSADPRTTYLIGRRGQLDGIALGDLTGFNYGSGIHHITRVAQVVPAAIAGRPPRGFWTLGGNEGRGTNAGVHLTYYPGPNIAAASRWDYR